MPKNREKLHTILSDYTVGGNIGNGGAGSVYSVTDENGGNRRPFYVMPLYDGSLRKAMKEGWYEPPNLLPMYLKMLSDLDAFHAEGNVHRDIKPENMLIDRKNDLMVLADFGVAHVMENFPGAAVETRTGDRLANFAYASPEQRAGNARVDRGSDIFSFGLILVEIFTGVAPFGTGYLGIGDKWEEYKFLDEVASRMLSQNPADRYSSLGEVIANIDALSRVHKADSNLSAILKVPSGVRGALLHIDPGNEMGRWRCGRYAQRAARRQVDRLLPYAPKRQPRYHWV